MADLQDRKEQIRRRQRGIAFFDYGDSSPFEEEKTSTPRGMRYPAVYEQYVGQAIRYTIIALRGLAILLATVMLLGVGLRTLGTACAHLPSRTPGCRSALIRSTNPYLSTFTNGTTPLTGTFTELTKIVQMAPSLSVVGTAMHLVSANFSSTHDELKEFPQLYQTNTTNLDALTETMGAAIGAAELFSHSDFTYRDENLLWGRNGMESIGKMIDTYLNALNESSSLAWSAVEQTMHRIPFAARHTPAYDIAYTYFYFGGQQWLELEQLVHMGNDSSTHLAELIRRLENLESHLEKVVAENKILCAPQQHHDPASNSTTNSTAASALCHLDPSLQLHKIHTIRAASTWSHSVVSKAHALYNAAFHAIREPTNALQLDIGGYTSFLPSKGTVSTTKIRRLLEAEMDQLTKYTLEAQKWELLMVKLGKRLTKGSNVGMLNERVDAAIVKGRGDGGEVDHEWWGVVAVEHGEL